MKFKNKLIKGKILKRYKRFLADIELKQKHLEHNKGDIITVHTANTGSMKTCWEPGWDVMISYHDNPKRKLKYSLEMSHNGETWIGINTSLPNKIAHEAVLDGKIKELKKYKNVKPEIKISNSRIDLLCFNGDDYKTSTDKCYVEVKNVTLLGENKMALFPDAVSERGQKHLRELIDIKKSGIDSKMLFIIQREDINKFKAADHIDPTYSNLLKEAHETGVEILAYQCSVNEKEIEIKKKIKVIV